MAFGRWDVDEHASPAFAHVLAGKVPPWSTTFGRSTVHYHAFGNDCMTVLATNHGTMFLLDGRRGFTLVGTRDVHDVDPLESLGMVIIRAAGKMGVLSSTGIPRAGPILAGITFGTVYTRRKGTFNGLAIQADLFMPPGNVPELICLVSVHNTTGEEITFDLATCWGTRHVPLSKSLLVSWHGRRAFARGKAMNAALRAATGIQRMLRFDTDGARQRHAGRIRFSTTRDPVPPGTVALMPVHARGTSTPRDSPTDVNHHPAPLALSSDPGSVPVIVPRRDVVGIDGPFSTGLDPSRLPPGGARNGDLVLVSRSSVTVPAGGVVARASRLWLGPLPPPPVDDEDPGKLLAAAIEVARRRSVTLASPAMPWLERECTWHSAYVLSSVFTDEFRGSRRVPQGSVYLFGHGFDGSIRDFCLYLVPLTFMDPELAREFALFVLGCVDPVSGRVPYALHGVGKELSIPLVHSNPSDQYFFVTWAIMQYICFTGDDAFLDEPVRHVAKDGKSVLIPARQVLASVIRHVLSPAIGIGPHGMVRVRDGDWNDGITLMARDRRAFVRDGESCFNSAMLLVAFPAALPVIEALDPGLAQVMRDAITSVSAAVDRAWNGSWYYRGWDGKGNPLGDDTVFLDHHVWLLAGNVVPPDRRAILVTAINDRLIARSMTGAAIMDPPNQRSSILRPGWDVNGGTWHALNSLLAWALRRADPSRAFPFLERSSMHRKAGVYPGIWHGVWSGPDAINADDAEAPGDAFYHAATPMRDFPFMNNNLHAGFLAAAIRVAGISASPGTFTVDLDVPEPFTFTSAIIAITKGPADTTIEIRRPFTRDIEFAVRLPPGVARVVIDGKPLEMPRTDQHLAVPWNRDKPWRELRVVVGG